MLTPVWRLLGLTGSEPGYLEMKGERLIYQPADDPWPGFDLPLSEVSDINFPWHYLGGGSKCGSAAKSTHSHLSNRITKPPISAAAVLWVGHGKSSF